MGTPSHASAATSSDPTQPGKAASGPRRKHNPANSIIWGGLFVYGLLFFSDALFGPNLSVFGVKDPEIEKMVIARWGTTIVAQQLLLLGIILGLGTLLGCMGRWLWHMWSVATNRPPLRSKKTGFLLGAGTALLVHVALLLIAIVQHPSLYVESFYSKGGLRKQLMVFLTHHIGLRPLVVGFALLSALLLLPPLFMPATWKRLRSWVSSRGSTTKNMFRLGLPTIAAALAITITWLASAGPKRPPISSSIAPRPSVLVLAVDSLRADMLDDPVTAPTLHALAQKSVRFDAMHVTIPRTFPSWITLLSGRYPHHHGVRTMFPSFEERSQIGPMLPQALRQAGYKTTVISDFAGEIFCRFDAGFDRVQVPGYDAGSLVQQRGITLHPNVLPYLTRSVGRRLFPGLNSLAELSDPVRLADQTIQALEAQSPENNPFFMVSFFSTAHFPYAAPEPAYRQFGDPHYRGPFLYHKQPLEKTDSDADQAQVRSLYKAAVFSVDQQIARILQTLHDTGLDRSTIIVILADHGENLYDPPVRGMGHGDHLEGDKTTHIPLLMYDPDATRFPAHRVPGIVRDIDLAPTLLERLNISSATLTYNPATGMEHPLDGVSLLPLLAGKQTSLGLASFGETGLWFVEEGPGFEKHKRLPYLTIAYATSVDEQNDITLKESCRQRVIMAKHRSLRTERYKLLYRPTLSGVTWSLYDLQHDPDEQHDVIDDPAHHNAATALKQQLRTFLEADRDFFLEHDLLIARKPTGSEVCVK